MRLGESEVTRSCELRGLLYPDVFSELAPIIPWANPVTSICHIKRKWVHGLLKEYDTWLSRDRCNSNGDSLFILWNSGQAREFPLHFEDHCWAK